MTIHQDFYSALPDAVKIQKYMEGKQMGSESSGITLESKIGGCDVPMQALDMSVHEISEMLWMEAVRGEYTPNRILRHGPSTIVFWADGTKTVVKRASDEPDNEYTAFTAALAIKIFGSNSKLKKIVKTFTEKSE